MGASCSPPHTPINCRLMPVGPLGWSLSGRACLETPVILSGTQEEELEGHGTSLQEGWTVERIRHSLRDPGSPQTKRHNPHPRGPRPAGPLACRQTDGPGATCGQQTSGDTNTKREQIWMSRFQKPRQTDRWKTDREADRSAEKAGRQAEGTQHAGAGGGGNMGGGARYLEWL